jgi:metal transporter CNNM
MMSIDPLFLAIKYRSGTVEEKRQASQILPLVKQHHFLLVTLLLMNSLANEALPIFLNDLVPDYVAVLLSVTLVLFFGEIIPSAIFTGPDQMSIAATLVPIVKIVMIVLSPIAYPISLLLDKVLHPNNNNSHHGANHSHPNVEEDADDSLDIVDFNREEIKALIRIQYEQGLKASMKDKQKQKVDNSANSTMKRSISLPPLQRQNSLPTPEATPPRRNSHHERVLSDEVELVEGALTLANRTIRDVCVPLHCVFVLDRDTTLLDLDTMAKIYSCGFSRIPVVVTPPHYSPPLTTHKSIATIDEPNEYTPLSRTTTPYNDKARICGILLTRQLIVINPNDQRPLSDLPLLQPLCVSPDLSILHMLQLFLKSSTHMAIVCQNPEIAALSLRLKRPIPHTTVGVLGIITLEDVLEELIKEEIYDEKDIKARNLSGQRIYSAMISATNRRNSKNKKDQQQQRVEFNGATAATITTRSTPTFGMKKASSQPQMYGTNATLNDTTSASTAISHVIPLSTQVSYLTASSEEENSEPLHILDRCL